MSTIETMRLPFETCDLHDYSSKDIRTHAPKQAELLSHTSHLVSAMTDHMMPMLNYALGIDVDRVEYAAMKDMMATCLRRYQSGHFALCDEAMWYVVDRQCIGPWKILAMYSETLGVLETNSAGVAEYDARMVSRRFMLKVSEASEVPRTTKYTAHVNGMRAMYDKAALIRQIVKYM
jgi:hypothetical protein